MEGTPWFMVSRGIEFSLRIASGLSKALSGFNNGRLVAMLSRAFGVLCGIHCAPFEPPGPGDAQLRGGPGGRHLGCGGHGLPAAGGRLPIQ